MQEVPILVSQEQTFCETLYLTPHCCNDSSVGVRAVE
jgi:hypothetical protein